MTPDEAESRGGRTLRPFVPEPSSINLFAEDPRPCPACDELTLMVVTTTARYEDTAKTIGGWALCTYCGATPHPVMEAPRDCP